MGVLLAFLKHKKAAPRTEHIRNFHERPWLRSDHDSQVKFPSLYRGQFDVAVVFKPL